jgi:hypothetical protein
VRLPAFGKERWAIARNSNPASALTESLTQRPLKPAYTLGHVIDDVGEQLVLKRGWFGVIDNATHGKFRRSSAYD